MRIEEVIENKPTIVRKGFIETELVQKDCEMGKEYYNPRLII